MSQRKIQIDQLELSGSSLVLPAGVILPYAAESTPSNFLHCDGSVVSQTTYAELFAVIGSSFNTGGEGAGNFRLPDMQGNVPVGKKSTGAFNTFTDTPGSEDVTLTSGQIPSHAHTATGSTGTEPDHTHAITGNISGGSAHRHWTFGGAAPSQTGASGGNKYVQDQAGWTATDGAHTHTTSGLFAVGDGAHDHTVSVSVNNNTGGGGSHSNIQPSLVIRYIISTGV